jgi:hypothetical protein
MGIGSRFSDKFNSHLREQGMRPEPDKTVDVMRRLLLGVLVVGMLGIGAELILLRHYEDNWQLAPLALIAIGMATIGWHFSRPSAASIRALQTIMTLFVAAGGLGILLHYRAAMEFQLESGTATRGWLLFVQVMHAKVPPALAPGAMVQLGLLGLIYTFRHSGLARSSQNSPQTQST